MGRADRLDNGYRGVADPAQLTSRIAAVEAARTGNFYSGLLEGQLLTRSGAVANYSSPVVTSPDLVQEPWNAQDFAGEEEEEVEMREAVPVFRRRPETMPALVLDTELSIMDGSLTVASALERVIKFVQKGGLLIIFAGHGRNDSGDWILADGDLTFPAFLDSVVGGAVHEQVGGSSWEWVGGIATDRRRKWCW